MRRLSQRPARMRNAVRWDLARTRAARRSIEEWRGTSDDISASRLPQCFVQNLDNVGDGLTLPPTADSSAKLQHASGIRSHDAIRAGAVDRGHFLLQQRHGEIGMHYVVDPGATATAVRHRHLFDRQPGHAAQQFTGRGAYALAVREMAGVLI